eukprot:1869430-Amphidinium_carterae.1
MLLARLVWADMRSCTKAAEVSNQTIPLKQLISGSASASKVRALACMQPPRGHAIPDLQLTWTHT